MGLSCDARPGWLFRLFAAWRARIAWHDVAKTPWFVVGFVGCPVWIQFFTS